MWVLENLLLDEKSRMSSNFVKMKAGLDRLNVPYKLLKTIPFIHEFEENITEIPNFVYGSTITLKAAQKADFPVYIAPTESEVMDKIGCHYLNSDMVVLDHDEVLYYMNNSENEYFFIKPNNDLKSFDGTVIDSNKYPFFIENVMSTNNFDKTTKICVSGIKHVKKEWRVFVVDNKISTYSQYMINRKVVTENSIPDDAIIFLQQVIESYCPSPMYVIDVCQDESESYKIVEYNTINCSGLYDSNVEKLITDIEIFN